MFEVEFEVFICAGLSSRTAFFFDFAVVLFLFDSDGVLHFFETKVTFFLEVEYTLNEEGVEALEEGNGSAEVSLLALLEEVKIQVFDDLE